MVSWEPLSLEEARGFITGYTVTATDQFGLYVRQMPVLPVTVGPHQTTATLCCLHPRHGYRISLSASTKHGESDVKMQISEPVGKSNITLTINGNGIDSYCNAIRYRQTLHNTTVVCIRCMWSCDCGSHLFVAVCLPVLCVHKVKCMALVVYMHVAFISVQIKQADTRTVE